MVISLIDDSKILETILCNRVLFEQRSLPQKARRIDFSHGVRQVEAANDVLSVASESHDSRGTWGLDDWLSTLIDAHGLMPM